MVYKLKKQYCIKIEIVNDNTLNDFISILSVDKNLIIEREDNII